MSHKKLNDVMKNIYERLYYDYVTLEILKIIENNDSDTLLIIKPYLTEFCTKFFCKKKYNIRIKDNRILSTYINKSINLKNKDESLFAKKKNKKFHTLTPDDYKYYIETKIVNVDDKVLLVDEHGFLYNNKTFFICGKVNMEVGIIEWF